MDVDEQDAAKDIELKELGRVSWNDEGPWQSFLRGVEWSPSGKSLLTCVNGQGLKVVDLPEDLQSGEVPSHKRPLDLLEIACEIPESGTVYDFSWLPGDDQKILSTSQHNPIKLYNTSGDHLCTYRGYDDVDEVENALSVTSSTDGLSIIGGYRKNIKIFATDRPGREYRTVSTKCPISAITEHENLVVAGSWNKSVILFDSRTPTESLSCFVGHSGGITMMKFSHDGHHLFIGARKNHCLLKWDLRNLSVTAVLYQRYVDTNQRIQFDISSGDEFIASGDCRGVLHLWDFQDDTDSSTKFPIHHDCCNGVAFHPTLPIIASASGQHHSENVLEDNSGLEDDNDPQQILVENSLNLWYLLK